MKIKVGLLIVGSLYWDNQVHRSQWRSERLDVDAQRGVFAPIRYGRRSQKRGSTYTMVFSGGLVREESKLGKAIAVPFKRLVMRVEDLIKEAELLWAAERNSNLSNGKISANWGCVGLAENPAQPIPDELRDGWAAHVSLDQSYGNIDQANDETAIIEGTGLLNIPWPNCLDGLPLQVNALLATTTNPTLVGGGYPSAQEIADTWKTDEGRDYVHYFWNNRKHNIVTFQDKEIESHLNK